MFVYYCCDLILFLHIGLFARTTFLIFVCVMVALTSVYVRIFIAGTI